MKIRMKLTGSICEMPENVGKEFLRYKDEYEEVK